MIDIQLFDKRQEGLVSIIIPSYNYGHFLIEALEGIRKQLYQEIEIIVLDDCSTDNTEKIIKKWENRFDNFIFIRLPIRLPPEWVINVGFIISRGKYIVIHDADDISREDKIEQQVKWLREHPETAVVGSKYQDFIDNKDRIKGYSLWVCTDRVEINRVYKETAYHCVCFGTIMFRASILNKLMACRTVRNGFGDYDFIKRIIDSNYIIDNIDEYLFYVRNHSAQSTKRNKDTFVLKDKFSDNEKSYNGISVIMINPGDGIERLKGFLSEMSRGYSNIQVIIVGEESNNNIAELNDWNYSNKKVWNGETDIELLSIMIPGKVVFPGLYFIGLQFTKSDKVLLYTIADKIATDSLLKNTRKFAENAGINKTINIAEFVD